MARHRPWIVLLAILLIAPPVAPAAALADRTLQVRQLPSHEHEEQLIIKARVRRIHAPRLFTLEDPFEADRAWLVLVPGAEATPMAGTTVVAGGVLRRLTQAELSEVDGWNEIDERTRQAFDRRPVLIARSVVTSTGSQLVRQAVGRPVITITRPSRSDASVETPVSTLHTVRPSAVASLIDELAGQTVHLRNARVVGVLNPRAFLIESATSFPAMLGTRDRILVLVGGGTALRIAPAALVASRVTVAGVARTLLGVQITAEVPWPPELTREVVERLEVRAALLATSVQTAEGVELTDRPSPEKSGR